MTLCHLWPGRSSLVRVRGSKNFFFNSEQVLIQILADNALTNVATVVKQLKNTFEFDHQLNNSFNSLCHEFQHKSKPEYEFTINFNTSSYKNYNSNFNIVIVAIDKRQQQRQDHVKVLYISEPKPIYARRRATNSVQLAKTQPEKRKSLKSFVWAEENHSTTSHCNWDMEPQLVQLTPDAYDEILGSSSSVKKQKKQSQLRI